MLTLANLLASAMAFVVIPVFLRQLGYADFGRMTLLQTAVFVAIAVFNIQVWIPLSKLMIRDEVNRDTWVKTGLMIDLGLAGLSSLLFLLVFWAFATLSQNQLVFEWLPPCLIWVLCSPSGAMLANFRVSRRYGLVALYSLLPAILRLTLAFILPIENITDALWINALAEMAKLPFLAYSYWLARSGEMANWMTLVRNSMWGWLTQLADLPIAQLDRFIVAALLGLELVAVYQIMRRIGSVFSQFAGPLYQVLYPSMIADLAHKGKIHVLSVGIQMFWGLLLAGMAGVAFAYATSDFWMHYFIGDEFQGRGFESVLYVLLLIQAVAVACIFIHPLLLAVGGERETLYITILANSVFMASLQPLAVFGMWGVLLAIALQYSLAIGPKFCLVWRKKMRQ